MKKRKPLSGPILLSTSREPSGTRSKIRTICVTKTISDKGNSVICYEAYDESGLYGTLREYYPNEKADSFKRRNDGQLVFAETGALYGAFLRNVADFVDPYTQLKKVRNLQKNLTTFISDFDILYGCDEKGDFVGTVYIWSPIPEAVTFERLCHKIHTSPTVEPEKKLLTALWAIESLIDCSLALAKAGFEQYDIKPSNFGFPLRNGTELTEALQWFDLGSIRPVDISLPPASYTEEYAPSNIRGCTCLQADIYAIGCTLLEAIVDTDKLKKDESSEKKWSYNDTFFPRLNQLVKESVLISSSENNNHPYLIDILTTILERCLSSAVDEQYQSLEDLLSGLREAIRFAEISANAGKNKYGLKWILVDGEETMDEKKKQTSSLAIAYQLYAHPLFEKISSDKKQINVLVLGFGKYGQRFLDACLQSGQIVGKDLAVTVISRSPQSIGNPNANFGRSDKDIYIKSRPELGDFFTIDGKKVKGGYGSIDFYATDLSLDFKKSTSIVRDFLQSEGIGTEFDYIFIALGDDRVNKAAASEVASTLKSSHDCVLSYVVEKAPTKQTPITQYALYVYNDFSKTELYLEMERMAFNIHLLWESNLNIDFDKVRKIFEEPYYHYSCISPTLALKSKLYGVDPDLVTMLDKGNDYYAKVADIVSESLNQPGKMSPAITIREELMWIEHRRWVTEKLCQGWTRITDLDECAGGMTKDTANKRHICIVKGSGKLELQTKQWTDKNHQQWDKDKSKLLPKDEFDTLSVELHRMYKKHAQKAQGLDIIQHPLSTIVSHVAKEPELLVALREWIACVNKIKAGNVSSTRLYQGFKSAFEKKLVSLPIEEQQFVKDQVASFDRAFTPILACKQYKDWKAIDAAFVDGLPFILTYTTNSCLVVPYKVGNVSDMFSNVASATIVNPEHLVFLCFVTTPKSVTTLQNTIPYLLDYMQRKQLRAKVEFVLVCSVKDSAQISSSIQTLNKHFGSKIVISLMEYDGKRRKKTINALISPKMDELKSMYRFFAVEKNKDDFSEVIDTDYELDVDSLVYTQVSGRCEMLKCILNKPYISVSDITAMNSSFIREEQPEFYSNYSDLWNLYCSNKSEWKVLCDLLEIYNKSKRTIGIFQKATAILPKQYTYFLPIECTEKVCTILEYLKICGGGLVGRTSRVEPYSSYACQVIVDDPQCPGTCFEKLFSYVYYLMLPNELDMFETKKTVQVTFDSLSIENWDMTQGLKVLQSERPGFAPPTTIQEDMIRLLLALEKEGYIIDLTCTGSKGEKKPVAQNKAKSSVGKPLNFSFASKQVMKLLTNAGKMLEIYVFHELKASGLFDDVASGYEVEWKQTNNGQVQKNEIDCIVTKGFKTVLIECKACATLEQGFYNKLYTNKLLMGVDAKLAMITDLHDLANKKPNAGIIKDGLERYKIVTITDPNDIANQINALF